MSRSTKLKPTQKEGIKLTRAEVKMISDLDAKKQDIVNSIAIIGMEKLNLKIREENLEAEYKKNLEFENQIGEQLSSKYGDGTVDTENDLFLPS